jgi:hypothetical protein
MLEAGGADTNTERAIPGSEPGQGLCAFPGHVVVGHVVITPGIRFSRGKRYGVPPDGSGRLHASDHEHTRHDEVGTQALERVKGAG